MEFGHTYSSSEQPVIELAWRKWVDVVILVFINLFNYTDRYSLAGVLIDIQDCFEIRNEKAGFIQTVFVLTYMFAAPLCGYFGDRYNRKFILAFAVLLWNAANAACSFMKEFWAFLIFRAIFGIGQACFTTVAPTLISDLFVGDMRSRLIAIFYMAIPVGNGFGYIVGTQMTILTGDWRWSLRATPIVSIFNIILILVILRDPKRGEIEGGDDMKTTSWMTDVKYLVTNPSFMLSTLGFTAVAFTAGAVSWWAPKLNYLGFKTIDSNVDSHVEGSIFGVVSAISGFFGLCVGYLSTFKLKDRYPYIDPLVCGVGMVLAGPLLIIAVYAAMFNKVLCYTLLFLAFIFLNMNWALTMDICFHVVVPSRRSIAVGMQLLVGHGLGDAVSPYLTGLFSDILLDHFNEKSNDSNNEFYALQYSYLIGCVVDTLGSGFFFLNAVYLVRDVEKVMKEIEQNKNA